MDSQLPAEITDLVGSSHLQGHALLMVAATDIDDAGHAAEQWLLVTERECAVAVVRDSASNLPARCLRTFLFEHISGCRARTEVGSGYLQVCRNGVWVDLIRFSNRLTSQFRDVAHKLEHLRRHQEFPITSEDEADEVSGATAKVKGANATRSVPSWNTLGRVMRLLWPYRGQAALIGLLSVITVVIELIPPWLQKILVDNILGGKPASGWWVGVFSSLLAIVLCLLSIRLTAAVIAVWKASLSSRIGTRLTADLRMRMVDKLQKLSVAYHDRNQVGMLMSRVSYDTEAMHAFMHQLSGGFFLQLLQLFAIGIILFVLHPRLAFLTLLPMPLVLIASWFFCKYLYARHHRYWDAVGHQASALTSLLSGIRVVKSFTQEPREQQRFQDTSERLRESRVGLDLATATFSSLIGFLFGLGGLIVWYIGGRNVLAEEMTLGSLMAFLAYLSMFYAPLTTITEGATWISSFLAASHRIFELLDTPVSVSEPDEPHDIRELKGHLQFKDVNFSYEQKPALEGINFEVQQGESVGIVGRSGSGKSTLVCLVSRLYDVDSGQITIDGIDVRRISSAQLRRHVGMVLQEPFLFEGTISANIAYGDPQASPERIIASAKAASAHDFILNMPFGYETLLGEGGAGLSGGERQRVSIARAILYDPQILILDEATSSIDTESERLIQLAIERFSEGRTMMAIAHRLSTLERVDRLIVLDRGHIIEQGTHEDLMRQGGVYARLVKMQFGSKTTSLAAAATATVGEATGGQSDGSASASGDASHGEIGTDDESSSPPINEQDLQWEVRWLEPANATFFQGLHEILSLRLDGIEYSGIYMVRAFPATHSDEFLSVRHEAEGGRDRELGMIRKLDQWPQEIQDLVRRGLNRRYLLRRIQSFQTIREDNGFVSCMAVTDGGDVEFVVHNNSHNVKPFGYNGRLLTDLDQNHYLVDDVDELPFLQRRLFRHLFYGV